MNSLEFDDLQVRIVEHLSKDGATTSERLAAELAAPHGNVQFVLEQLSTAKEPIVKRLPFGLWGSTPRTLSLPEAGVKQLVATSGVQKTLYSAESVCLSS